MKKKSIIIAIIAILVIAIILFIVYKNGNIINGKQIIAEDSHINWAWGFSYSGTIICDDGSVYKFSMTDNEKEYSESYEDLKKLNKSILNNTTEYVCKISKDEINKIKEYSKNIKNENYTENYAGGTDMGQSSIIIWNYESNKRITLITSGDWEGKNSSSNVNELINLVQKYTIFRK